MGGMNALGGPGVWAGGQGGLQNLGQFGALGYPVRPGPEAEAALQHFGQQVPQHLQQTELFGGLEGKHPLLARMLEGGLQAAARTPGPEPGRAEGAGQGVSRALQGVLGAHQEEKAFHIAQIVAPYQLARQTAELQGAAQEQEARKAQIGEMGARADYFRSLASMTAPEARLQAAQMGMQFKDEELKAKQADWAAKADNYQARTEAMAQWHQKQYDTALQVGELRARATLGSAKMRMGATQQLSKLATSANQEYNTAIKNRDDLAKQLKDYTNSSDYLMGMTDPNSAASKKAHDIQTKLDVAQTSAEAAEKINTQFGDALKQSITFGTAFDESNPTNPRGLVGGERGTLDPSNPAGLKF